DSQEERRDRRPLERMMAFSTIDLTARIGTEIRTDAATLVSGKHADTILALLQQRGVLIVRGLHMSREDQLAFSHTLG
ncbi:unnamed protein product, partial [marine sediment metagenome]